MTNYSVKIIKVIFQMFNPGLNCLNRARLEKIKAKYSRAYPRVLPKGKSVSDLIDIVRFISTTVI